jgi:dihydroceramide fatty acyl 2-hydroxylase
MLRDAALFAAGLFAWTIVEYVIHGTLAHAHRTFVTERHMVHHRDPSAVFAIRLWPVVALLWIIGLASWGFGGPMVYFNGLLFGFAAYEFVHYRIHFRMPASNFEARLRARHLAHHAGAPGAWFGVTTRLWDVVFGSEPEPSRRVALLARAAAIEPLRCPSNFSRITRWIAAWR